MARWMLGRAISGLLRREEITRVESEHPGPIIPAMGGPKSTCCTKFIRAFEKMLQLPSTLISSTLYPGRVLGSSLTCSTASWAAGKTFNPPSQNGWSEPLSLGCKG